jgi:hypothetical protein
VNIRTVTAGGAGLALALALAVSASAQTPLQASSAATGAQSPAAAEPKGDVHVGVNLGNWVRNRGVVNRYKSGWNAGASYRITHVISVIGDLAGDYQKLPGFTAHIYTYTGGARFQTSNTDQHVSPFLQIMLGAGQDNGDGTGNKNHYPVVSPGGGVDAAVGHHAAIRLRLDFPLYATFGDVYKGARVSAGLSFPFGKR